jgi:hypothetical protein
MGASFAHIFVRSSRQVIKVRGFSGGIDDPIFLDAAFFVGSQLFARIIVKRCVCNLDDKENVFRSRMSVFDLPFVKNEIRLWFIKISNANWSAWPSPVASLLCEDETTSELIDDCGVPRANWNHTDDSAIEEFDPFGGGKDSGFSELVILGDREFSHLRFESSSHTSVVEANLPVLAFQSKPGKNAGSAGSARERRERFLYWR